jgi:hypothetical protein
VVLLRRAASGSANPPRPRRDTTTNLDRWRPSWRARIHLTLPRPPDRQRRGDGARDPADVTLALPPDDRPDPLCYRPASTDTAVARPGDPVDPTADPQVDNDGGGHCPLEAEPPTRQEAVRGGRYSRVLQKNEDVACSMAGTRWVTRPFELLPSPSRRSVVQKPWASACTLQTTADPREVALLAKGSRPGPAGTPDRDSAATLTWPWQPRTAQRGMWGRCSRSSRIMAVRMWWRLDEASKQWRHRDWRRWGSFRRAVSALVRMLALRPNIRRLRRWPGCRCAMKARVSIARPGEAKRIPSNVALSRPSLTGDQAQVADRCLIAS